MKIPKIGDTITPKMAMSLCREFELYDLAEAIWEDQAAFRDWVFDGASCVNDALTAKVCGIPNLTTIALVHDLKYAYGIPCDDRARMEADLTFALAVLRDGANPKVAQAMFDAVRHGGAENLKMSFSWGFARYRVDKGHHG